MASIDATPALRLRIMEQPQARDLSSPSPLRHLLDPIPLPSRDQAWQILPSSRSLHVRRTLPPPFRPAAQEITYSWLAQQLQLHPNASKQLLFQFNEENRATVQARPAGPTR